MWSTTASQIQIIMQSDQTLTHAIQPTGLNVPADLFRNISRYLSDVFMIPAVKKAMSTPVQQNNLMLLADQVLAFGVEGDLVEFGCHEGSTARAIALANDQHGNERSFHVYDDFKFDPRNTGMVKENFINSFKDAGLTVPQVHEGEILQALASELPDTIAFAHVDLGFEEDPRQVERMVRRCLEAIYPRMSPGAVCVLMDYHDPVRTLKGWDCSPGVKMACDKFLLDKPEQMSVLFGEEYSHAFFRKTSEI